MDYQTLIPVINILSGIKVDLGGLSLMLRPGLFSSFPDIVRKIVRIDFFFIRRNHEDKFNPSRLQIGFGLSLIHISTGHPSMGISLQSPTIIRK